MSNTHKNTPLQVTLCPDFDKRIIKNAQEVKYTHTDTLISNQCSIIRHTDGFPIAG